MPCCGDDIVWRVKQRGSVGWITGCGGGETFAFDGVFVNEPVVSFKPNAYNNMAAMIVMRTNGINTIIHEIIPKPP
jgi:hypothetical protein